ncbi:MAG: Rne/Rng family ribonuclease [Deltaproteobacteria bacterium]|nr:Rne/Rng family ribonuclease [Deltaproteobacteria bacterium]
MAKRIVVSVDPYEARAALMEGDRLVNIEVESAASEKRKGSIYRGKVMAVEPSFEAAFVNYGKGKEGFLPFDEVCEKSLIELTGHGRGKGKAGVRVGDTVLVQVTKEEVGKKGAALSMHVSLPGRYVVLMPFDDRTGISRKLDQDERNRLRKVLRRLGLPEGFGVIVRTSGESTDSPEDLQLELDHLIKEWEQVVEKFKSGKEPAEIRADAGLAVRFIRDYLSSDVDEILVEDEYSMRELQRYMESCMPRRLPALKRFTDEIPLFLRYGVERQVEALLRRRVHLPSGGSIVVGETEALVAIDVNSGRLKRKGIEDTAFRTNIEAAREIARQVVLRDLGGIIVVDFIDMESETNRVKVADELKAAMAMDKARLTFGRISDFGLLAFSRQRIRQSVDSGVNLDCPTCSGTGRIRSSSSLAMSALRTVRERLATQSKKVAYVEVVVPVRVANFLNNRKREALVGLEKHHGVLVDVTGDSNSDVEGIRVNVLPEVPHDRTAIFYPDEEPETEVPPPPPPSSSPKPEDNGHEKGGFKNFLRMVLGIPESPEPPEPSKPAPVAVSAPPVPVGEPDDVKPSGTTQRSGSGPSKPKSNTSGAARRRRRSGSGRRPQAAAKAKVDSKENDSKAGAKTSTKAGSGPKTSSDPGSSPRPKSSAVRSRGVRSKNEARAPARAKKESHGGEGADTPAPKGAKSTADKQDGAEGTRTGHRSRRRRSRRPNAQRNTPENTSRKSNAGPETTAEKH